MIEVLKQALAAFEDLKKNHGIVCVNEIVDLRKAIAELESQEPVIDKSAAIRIATVLGWTPPLKENT